MSETSVKGREVLLKRPPMTIFSLFSDLSLLVQNVPEEYGGKIQADKDSVHIEYKGIKFGIVVDRREPFSLVVLKDDGQSFLPFTISFFMDPVGIDSTLFHIELTAELNFMMKMMIGNKLQEMVDSITDQIEKAINSLAAGQSVDFSDIKPPVDAAGTVYSTAYTLPRSRKSGGGVFLYTGLAAFCGRKGQSFQGLRC